MYKPLYRTSGNRISSFSTVVGISLVLTVLGVVFILYFVVSGVATYYEEQIVVNVFIRNDVDENEVMTLKKKIEGEDYARSVSYLSARDAAEQFKKEIGHDFEEVAGYNPLQATLEIKLNAGFTSPDVLEKSIEPLRHESIVDDVMYKKGLLQQVHENKGKWSIAFLLVGALLLVIAVALINNTIMLAVFSQRFIIKSMQLVGATQWFIQKPFLWRGIKYGLISALFALTILSTLLWYLRDQVPMFVNVLLDNYRYLYVAAAVAGTGLLVSWFSTALAVRRFVVLKQEKLY